MTGRRVLRLPPGDPLGRVLFEFARTHPNAFIVQIGAHDASQLDPVRRYILEKGWRGVLVEPQPAVFERLKRNYADVDGLIFENVAVAPTEGSMDLYYLPQTSDDELPPWYDALASFDRDVLLSHERMIPDIASRVRTMSVGTVTFEQLCSRHGIAAVDVVQIDTEGYDYEVLKLIDLDRFRPTLVQFEELHMDEETRRAAIDHLVRRGFETLGSGMDRLAVHPGRLDERTDVRLLRVWRRLQRAAQEPAS